MPITRAANRLLSVNAFRGDAKTLLAFELADDANRERLAGFTVEIRPPGGRGYFADNNLRLAPSGDHAQIGLESPFATVNAPVQGFRWVHAAGAGPQNRAPTFGRYAYVVTPRYFSERNALLPLDRSAGVVVDVDVAPFAAGALKLGFTRGYVHSQAFARRFGTDTAIRPRSEELLFDTAGVAGADARGDTHTYAEQNEWLGFTARSLVVDLIEQVRADPSLRMDLFTCELDEPDVCAALLALGGEGRVRIVLDAPALDDTDDPTSEDRFAAVFTARAGCGALERASLGSSPHRTVMVVADADGPRTVLTSSAGLSLAGLYVGANHVLQLEDRPVARVFADVFDGAWRRASATSRRGEADGATTVLDDIGRLADAAGVLIDFSPRRRTPEGTGEDRALTRVDLREVLHIRTHGTPAVAEALPTPFDRPALGAGHDVDHEFTVCGFRGAQPVVSCGSFARSGSNGRSRGADVLTIRDEDVAAAFVIEALQLDDYHRFIARLSRTAEVSAAKLTAYPDKRVLATASGWFLHTTDAWADRYLDPSDTRHAERKLFGR